MADLELDRGSIYSPKGVVLSIWFVFVAILFFVSGLEAIVITLAGSALLGAMLLAADSMFCELVVRPKPASTISGSSARQTRRLWSGIRQRNRDLTSG